MKIAQIAPISERVPPRKYGGTERVIYELTEELVKRGHDVTLFASGDSITSAKLVSVIPKSLREARLKDPYGLNEFTFLHIARAYELQNEFDIIHDHNYVLSMPVANLSKTPVVQTIHGAFHESNIPLYSQLKKINLVTISHAQAPKNTDLNIVGTVYNGQTMTQYPFSNIHEGYLLFVGRIAMEKGVHHAIEVAQMVDLPLILAGRVDNGDLAYYDEYIKPKLDGKKIRWIGEVNAEERNALMSKAICFLHPVTWPEPFGLTLIESMACGCPVVGFGKGSIPEIIQHGKTGFVVHTVNEMADAVSKIRAINRYECRKYVLEQFNAQKMTDGYEAIYTSLLKGKRLLKTSHPDRYQLPMPLFTYPKLSN
jgi:glycosyltransferase involved in cell wall biosynthesis